MKHLKDNSLRARNAIKALWAVLIASVLLLAANYMQYLMLTDITNGYKASEEELANLDLRNLIVVLIYLTTFVISAVMFIKWFRRAYANIRIFFPNLSYGDTWTVWTWFVPVVNLYVPYKIMRELHEKTDLLLFRNKIKIDVFGRNYLTLWWTLWIVNIFVGRIVTRIYAKAETISQLTQSSLADICLNILGIILVPIAIQVVRQYAEVEPLLHQIQTDKAEQNT